MTTPPDDTQAQWAEMCSPLPDHQTEVMAAHQGTPGTGVPAPAVDRGMSDQAKYSGTEGIC